MIIDGKKIAEEITNQLKIDLEAFKKKHLHLSVPGLTFILIGNNAASSAYVKMKKKGCEAVGFHSEVHHLDENVTEETLLKLIISCNKNKDVHGILVQLPLPSHLSEKKIIEAIDPHKDVDGFHPINIGKALLGHEDGFLPCTPLGIVTLLEKSNITVEGKHVVILGRSNIVGKPLAAMLVQKKPHCNATVTLAHSQTEHLTEICKTADILIAAIGKPYFVKKEMLKKNAVVIDVGINAIEDHGKRRLVGDVDFKDVLTHCSKITPVPGGVGPMTIAMLLHNTYLSFKRHGLYLKNR